MAVIPALRLTTKTADEIRRELVTRIPTLTDKWTNFNDAELGMVLLTLLSGIAEMLSFELDMRASETTVTHVRQRSNAIRLLKLIGYRFQRPVAARTTLRITFGVPTTQPVRLTDYSSATPVVATTRTSPTLSFVVPAEVIIPAGLSVFDVDVIQGTPVAAPVTVSTGQPNQSITFTATSIAEGAIRVKVNGIFWEIVDNFINSNSTSRHVVEETDELGQVRLVFGDGVSGQIPSGNIEIFYVLTNGEDGNFSIRGRVSTFSTFPKYNDGSVISPAPLVSNIEPSTGGEPEESLFHAKKQAPREYQAQQRAVTKKDFVAWAEGFPGIKQATCLDINDVGVNSFDIDYFEIKIPIVPTGLSLFPSAALKRSLQEYLNRLKAVPDNIEVVDPNYRQVDFSVDIFIRKSFVSQSATVISNVQSAIINYFSIAESPSAELAMFGETEGQLFGGSVSALFLQSLVQSTPGVASVVQITPSEDIQLGPFELPILSSGSPIVNIVGAV